MADNVVEILVRSKNKTKQGNDEAIADAEAAANRVQQIWEKHGQATQKSLASIGRNSAAGGGLFAGAAGALALAAPLGAAGLAVGAFGAVAIPIFENLNKSVTANQAAQLAYNHAVEKAKQSYDQAVAGATNAKQKAAALATEQKALDSAQLTLDQHTTKLSGSQQGLANQVTKLQTAWKATQTAMAPVVLTVAKLGVGLLTSLMPALQALASAGAKVLTPFINNLAALVKSPFFTQFTQVMAKTAAQIGPLLGAALTGLLKILLQLFVSLMPAGVQILKILLPLILLMATDLVPVITAVANLTAKMLTWLQVHHLLLPVLALLAVAILALDAPVAAVVAAIAILITAGVELSKHWKQIWTDIKNWFNDGVHAVLALWDNLIKRIKDGFDHLAAPLKTALTVLFTIWKVEWDLVAAYAKIVWAQITFVVKTAFDIIAAFFKIWFSVVTAIFRTAWDIIAAIFKVFIAILTGNWTAALNAIKAVTGQVWNNIKSLLAGVWGDIRGLAAQIGNNVRNAFTAAWNAIYGATRAIWGNIGSFLRGIGTTIISYFANAGRWLFNSGQGILNGLLSGMKSIWQSIVNFFKGLPSAILHALGIKSPPDWAISAGQHIMNGIGIGMNKARSAAARAAKAVASSVAGAFGGEAPPGSSAAGAQRYAKDLLGAFGWTRDQFDPLLRLWNQESGWRWNALNPSSGAYGIPQSLPASKMASAGADWRTNAGTQIRWGLGYIHDRYGSPAAAWAHEVSNNWYRSGGITSPGWAMVGEAGRELVKLPGGATVYSAGQTERMLSGGGSGLRIVIELGESFKRVGLTSAQLKDIKATVRQLGGRGDGNVQAAFGG